MKKGKMISLSVAIGIALLVALYAAAYMNALLAKQMPSSWNLFYVIKEIFTDKRTTILFANIGVLLGLGIYCLFLDNQTYKSDKMQITDNIATPVSAGQGQCGTAKWLKRSEFSDAFESYTLDAEALSNFEKKNLEDILKEIERIDKEESGGKQIHVTSKENNGEQVQEGCSHT